MLIVLGVSATDASAQSGVTIVTPTIQGSGATTAAGYSCSLSIAPNTDPTNSSTSTCAAPNVTPSIPSCAFVTRDGCIWNYTANAALTAVPAAGWQFVTWVDCNVVDKLICKFTHTELANPTIQGFPRATFREIVAITGDGVPEDFAFSPDFTSASAHASASRRRFPAASTAARSATRPTPSCRPRTSAPPPSRPAPTCPTASTRTTSGPTTTTTSRSRRSPRRSPSNCVSPATALDVLTGPQEGSLLTIGTATFAFSANEGGSFQCSLDGAPFTACASPVSYSGLAGGAHGFVVRALDSAGNIDAVGKSRSWTIFVPPAPIIITQGSTNPEQINATVAYGFNVKGSKTTLGGFNVKNVPFGSTVTVTCVAGTCPAVLYKKVKGKKVKQALVITKAFGTVSLKKLVSKPLKAGTVLEILVSKPGAIGAVKRLTIRKGKKPTLTSRCLPPGAKKSVAC